MNRYELLSEITALIEDEREEKAKRMSRDIEVLNDDMLRDYTNSTRGDTLAIKFTEFIVKMDEKLDKILEKL